MEDEAETVRAFIEPGRRDRWLSGLSSAKRMGKTVDRLHNSSDLDERYMRAPSGRGVEAVIDELVRLGAPTRCHVIGGPLDGEDHDLSDALDQALRIRRRTHLLRTWLTRRLPARGAIRVRDTPPTAVMRPDRATRARRFGLLDAPGDRYQPDAR